MTAPSSSDKIVDISARLSGGRGVTDQNQLLSTLKTRALRFLGGVVSGVLEKADDTLFDFVQRADGSLGQQEYFDAMRELRRQRAVVEKRFHEHLVDAFVALNDYYADFMADYLATDRARVHVIPHGLKLDGHGARTRRVATPLLFSP